MRWLNRDNPNTLSALGWRIVNDYVTYLIASTADAGWSGVGNTGESANPFKRASHKASTAEATATPP